MERGRRIQDTSAATAQGNLDETVADAATAVLQKLTMMTTMAVETFSEWTLIYSGNQSAHASDS